MNRKLQALIICVHNSARSQITEEYIRKYGGDLFEVESAGLEPGKLNPFVVEALADDGIDISGKKPKSVFELYRGGRAYQYVITVCDRNAEENCPVFPGPVVRLSWPFPDPSNFEGSHEVVAEQVRNLRDAIRAKVLQFLAERRSRKEMDEFAEMSIG